MSAAVKNRGPRGAGGGARIDAAALPSSLTPAPDSADPCKPGDGPAAARLFRLTHFHTQPRNPRPESVPPNVTQCLPSTTRTAATVRRASALLAVLSSSV